MATKERRKAIAEDTLARIDQIVQETPGASLESIFFDENTYPPLDSGLNPRYKQTPITVEEEDALLVARKIIRDAPSAKVAVLNIASDEEPAGGWLRFLTRTQEERLCYSTTLYPTLRPEWFPWPNLGPGSRAGIYSPSIVVFKDDLAHDCADLSVDERVILSIITVAGPRKPTIVIDPATGEEVFANESDVLDFRAKVRVVLRCAARSGQDHIVLGALGCGVYASPPIFIAKEMRRVLSEDEFQGWFKQVVFAVRRPTIYSIFRDIFKGHVMN